MRIEHAYFEITDYCNLNCRTCYNRSGNPHKKHEISFNQMKNAVDKLIESFSCFQISLAGGEPTLHTAFRQITDYILYTGRVDLSIVTNGTVNIDDLLSLVNQNEKVSVQVSLDGSDEKINAKTRGAGNFADALSFIKQLDTKKKKHKVKMIISKNNSFDVEAFYKLIISLDCIPVFGFVNNIGNAVESAISLTAQEKYRIITQIEKLNKTYNISSPPPYCAFSCPLPDTDNPKSVLVKTDGTIMPCQTFYDEKYAVGNMFNDTPEVITDNFSRIAYLLKEREKPDTECLRCLARKSCKRGCPALAVINNDDLACNDGNCSLRRLQFLSKNLP